jgi:hypothetical protein
MDAHLRSPFLMNYSNGLLYRYFSLTCILVLVQEVKRNIIFRRMQLTEPARLEVPKIRLQAHLLSVTRKLISLLEYQGIVQNNTPISFLTTFNATLISLVQ